MPTVSKQSPVKKSPRRKPSANVLDRIAPVSQSDKKLTVNVYGPSGSGKTTFACTFPKPLLLIGAEDGTQSVRDVSGVQFVRIYNSMEISELVTHCKEGGYESVVLDTATSLQNLCLMEVMGWSEMPAILEWGRVTRDQYGQRSGMMIDCLRRILSLAESGICHSVVLAQEKILERSEDAELTDAPYIMSDLSAAPLGFLNPECDYIVGMSKAEKTSVAKKKIKGKTITTVMKTGKPDYRLRTGWDEAYYTKFRLPKGTELPKHIPDPDYDKIVLLIHGA